MSILTRLCLATGDVYTSGTAKIHIKNDVSKIINSGEALDRETQSHPEYLRQQWKIYFKKLNLRGKKSST